MTALAGTVQTHWRDFAEILYSACELDLAERLHPVTEL